MNQIEMNSNALKYILQYIRKSTNSSDAMALARVYVSFHVKTFLERKVWKNSIFGRIDRTPFCLIAGQICTIPRPTRTTIFIYRRYLQKELMNAIITRTNPRIIITFIIWFIQTASLSP